MDKKEQKCEVKCFFKAIVFKNVEAISYLLISEYRLIYSSIKTNETCQCPGSFVILKRQSINDT